MKLASCLLGIHLGDPTGISTHARPKPGLPQPSPPHRRSPSPDRLIIIRSREASSNPRRLVPASPSRSPANWGPPPEHRGSGRYAKPVRHPPPRPVSPPDPPLSRLEGPELWAAFPSPQGDGGPQPCPTPGPAQRHGRLLPPPVAWPSAPSLPLFLRNPLPHLTEAPAWVSASPAGDRELWCLLSLGHSL